VLVCALGDLLLDVVVRLAGPLAQGDDAPAETRVGPGGQAANVAAWASALGGRGRFLGRRAADAVGRVVATDVTARGVELRGPIVNGRTGAVVSLVDRSGARTMASDRGVSPGLTPDDIEGAWLDGCACLHISGYGLVAEPMGAAAERATELAHRSGVPVSIDLSSWTAIRDFGPRRFHERLQRLAPDVLFATEREQEVLGRQLPAPTRVLKRGRDGCLFAREGLQVELPAADADVVDSTGAGDALAAGFLLGGSLEEAARRALGAAARCISQPGAMP
jgi:ribokinase